MLPFINKQLYIGDNKKIESYSNDNKNYPPLNSFHSEPNKLEAIVLLTTDREILSKRYFNFIKNMIAVRPPNKSYDDIDFIIGVNNMNHDPLTQHVLYLKTLFRRVFIINNNISKEDDIYFKKDINTKIAKFGFISGPNILFWDTLQQINKYNTVLVLETDCILYAGWLDAIINYVKYTGNFLISGSTYDGNSKISSNDRLFHHLNGVALYKIGSPALQFVIEELKEYILYQIKIGFTQTSYDFMLTDMILYKLKNQSSNSFDFWKLVYRNMIKNTLIVNASLPTDTSDSEESYLQKFPSCVILHKKK
jgi:hypothetical protein